MTLRVNLKSSIHNLRRGGEHVLVLLENKKGEILLTGKSVYPQGMYRLPGGGINKGESVEEAVVRELNEELGVHAETIKVLQKIDIVGKTPDRDYPLTQYLAYAYIGDQQAKITDEELNFLLWTDLNGLQQAIDVFESLEGEWQDYGKVYGPVHKIALEAYNRRSWTLLE